MGELTVTESSPKVALLIRAHLRGMSKAEICKEFRMAPTTLQRIMDTQLFRERVQHLSGQIDNRTVDSLASDPVRELLQGHAVEAARRNISLMNSEDERVQQASAWDILDRAGYTKKQRSEVTSTTRVFVQEDSVRALGEALRECMPSDLLIVTEGDGVVTEGASKAIAAPNSVEEKE